MELPIMIMQSQDAKNSKLIKDFTQNADKLNSMDKLADFMSKKYNIDINTAMKYGLIYFNKDSQKHLHYSDFFMLNNRILFPVRDHETGIVVGYQCRQTDLNAPKQYKYLNVTDYEDTLMTNENGTNFRSFIPLRPGNFLFNLYELKDKGTDIKALWVTEGIADAIKLSVIGYDVVSSGQANLTDPQIYLINKYFGQDVNINLFFDNDKNNVGQSRSIAAACRLWQFGFRNVRIISAFKEMGKDITDCSVKLHDDETLKLFISLWEKQACTTFNPANNEDLNTLSKTGLYTENEILSIDPRDIKQRIGFAEMLCNYINFKDTNYKQLTILKKLCRFNEEEINILSKLWAKDYDETQNSNIPETTTKKGTNIDTNNMQEERSIEENITNISTAQLFHLKKKFDMDLILKIDKECSKKQIGAIVGNIIKNKNFDVQDYIPKKADLLSTNNIYTTATATDDGNFILISDEDGIPLLFTP